MEMHRHIVERIMNMFVLLMSLAILVTLSMEMLPDTPSISHRFILRFHLAVCSVFLADYLVRFWLSPHKLHFFLNNLFFLLISIPWLNIVEAMHISVTPHLHVILRAVPLVRGLYGVALMIGWMTRSRITNLLASYITTLLATTYFTSILFYTLEKGINPMVKTFWDALVTWACMNVTTVGSDIFAVTHIGQILAVFLAAAGMMLFPIFTAYVTSKFQNKREEEKTADEDNV